MRRKNEQRTPLGRGLERLEDRRLLTGLVTQLNYFETWDGGIIPSTDPAGIAYHAPSGNLFLSDSEIDEIAQFQGDNIFELSVLGNQLFQEIPSGNTEPTGITYNEFDGFFYITNDDNHTIQRYGSNLKNPLTTIFTTVDDPNAFDVEGITSDPSTGYLYVIDGISGGLQVLAYSPDLEFEYSFSVASQLNDAEGIAFNSENNHLYVVSELDDLIVEYALNGAFVEQYDTSGLTPSTAAEQGLTFAPTSDLLDEPNNLALYIADGGLDNFPDGGVYEVSLSGSQLTQNTAPLVNAGGSKEFLLSNFPGNVNLNAGVADDGLPDSQAILTTSWSQVSGPGTVIFSDATVVDPTVTFPTDGTYILRLTADDGELTTSDDATIVIKQGVEIRVTASSDDAEERLATGKMFLTGADLDFGTDAGSNSTFDQLVGMRFSGLGIPSGATIDNAYLQFRADETDSVATSLTIRAEDADNSQAFSSAKHDLSSRTLSTSSVAWSPPAWTKNDAGLDQRTPDLSAVVQDIVDRPGWLSDNALAILISGTGERVAEPVDGNVPMFAPLLHVEYSVPGVKIIQSGITTEATEQGATDTYDMVLNTRPQTGTTVTVFLSTADGQTTTSPTNLTFDENTWNIPQTVTVTAVDDGLQESSPHTGIITHTAFSADSNYNGIAIGSVAVDIKDNDTPGVTITESGGSTDVTEDGATDTYDVVLDSPPQTGTTVTITASSIDGQTIANPISLVFNEFDWNISQTVTLTAVDDNSAENTSHTGTIAHTAVSADSNYNGIGINSITANIIDNDVAGVTISKTTAGGTVTSSTPIIIDTQVSASSDDAEERFSGVVKFTSKDLELVRDPTQSGVLQTVGIRFNGLTIPQGSVITNAYVQFEASGVDVGAVSLQLRGDDSDNAATFNTTDLNVSSRPATNASVAWAMPDWTLVGEAGINQQTPNIAPVVQEIVDRAGWVAGNSMALVITGTGKRTAVSFDGDAVNGTTGAPRLHVEYTSLINVDVSEDGATDTYDVALDTQPKAGTTVAVSLGTADGETSTNPTSLLFDENNWNVPQTVTIAAVDDGLTEGLLHGGVITHTAVSTDSDYNGVEISSVIANITDNDFPGVTITESGGSSDIAEGGATDTYDVVLDTQPQVGTTVTIAIASSDGQTITDTNSLVFNESDWNVPQTVTITAVDDDFAEGSPHIGTITHTAISTDSLYNGIGINSVAANITDNETAGVSISKTAGGSTSSTPVTIETQITVSSDDAEERLATGKMFLTGADLDFGTDAGSTSTFDQLVGLRFSGLGVPFGATINSAYIQFRADETDSVATSLTIRAEDADNAQAFSSTTGDLSSRTLTASSVAWSPPAWTKNGVGLDQQTPDLATIVQDIVDRPGWSGDNALAILISGTGERVAEPVDGNVPLFAPRLYVEYTTLVNVDVSEDGATDTYNVVLDSQPQLGTTVTITLGTADGQTTTNPTSLVFNENDWNIPQTVTVAAVDDSLAESSPHPGVITHTAISADSNYNGIGINSVTANIVDNDLPQEFTVNSFADTVDANPGDGLAQDNSGNTSLRAAVMEANATAGPTSIILPSGVYDNSLGQYEINNTTGSITIIGAGAATTSITGDNRAFNVHVGAELNISDLTMMGAGGAEDGGGIFNQGVLNLDHSTIQNYTGLLEGGGIFNASGGVATIVDSTIANNSALGQGGGIYNDNATLIVLGSTFHGNTAGQGGAIWTNRSLDISNSTVSSNSTADSGAIFSGGIATVSILNSTITNNSTGIKHDGTGTFSITNSVVAGNASDFSGSGTFTSGGYNLIGDVGSAVGFVWGVNGDQVGSAATPIDPLLGPLQDNGGPTLTHMILAGSPLINAGDPSFSSPPDFDQREATFSRVTFGQIDNGAVELNAASTAVDADFDGDTIVGGFDFLAWQRGFGTTSGAVNGDGDATGDGKVDGGDLAAWESLFGSEPPLAPLSVTAVGLDSTSSIFAVEESSEPHISETNQTVVAADTNYDGLPIARVISFGRGTQDLQYERPSFAKLRGLSLTIEVADRVFSEHADELRVFPYETSRDFTADHDDLMMKYGYLAITAECHSVDNVYDRLGNSLMDSDDLDWNNLSILNSHPNERRGS